MIGFSMNETMRGTHYFTNDPNTNHLIEFNIDWGPDNLLEWANPLGKRFLTQKACGKITVGGLCKDEDCSGSLELKYFSGSKICYKLKFNVEEDLYVFEGEKLNIRPWNFYHTHATCHGRLLYNEEIISRSTLLFDWLDLPKLLSSFTLT